MGISNSGLYELIWRRSTVAWTTSECDWVWLRFQMLQDFAKMKRILCWLSCSVHHRIDNLTWAVRTWCHTELSGSVRGGHSCSSTIWFMLLSSLLHKWLLASIKISPSPNMIYMHWPVGCCLVSGNTPKLFQSQQHPECICIQYATWWWVSWGSL